MGETSRNPPARASPCQPLHSGIPAPVRDTRNTAVGVSAGQEPGVMVHRTHSRTRSPLWGLPAHRRAAHCASGWRPFLPPASGVSLCSGSPGTEGPTHRPSPFRSPLSLWECRSPEVSELQSLPNARPGAPRQCSEHGMPRRSGLMALRAGCCPLEATLLPSHFHATSSHHRCATPCLCPPS